MSALVEYKVKDEHGVHTAQQLIEDDREVMPFIERVERMFIFDSSYVGEVEIFFGIEFYDTNEYDGFTRHYVGRSYLYTT